MTYLVEEQKNQGNHVFTFKDLKNIDVNAAHRIKAEIKGYMDNHNNHVIIDLDGIEFIDSTGFGALISILKTCKEKDKKLVLINVKSEILELMDLMQLLQVFDVKESLEDGIEFVKA